MQQTKLDQWLKETFLYETHIFTMRLPEDKLGRGVSVTDITEQKKGAYKYRLVIKSAKKSEHVIKILKKNHLMYATHVVTAQRSFGKFIAPEGGSFTYRWILRGIGLVCLISLGCTIYILLQNADLMKTLKETMRDFEWIDG